MTYIGWIGLFLLGICAAIYVVAQEVLRPKARLTVALRKWQTGLAGLIGFCGVWISLALQPIEADRQHKQQLYREALAMAMSMQVEAIDTRRWMTRVDELILKAGKVLKNAGDNDQSPELFAECNVLFDLARAHRYRPVGIIDSLRQDLGKLPHVLGLHFLDLSVQRQRLVEKISSATEEDCRERPQLSYLVLNEAAENVHAALARIEEGMKKLPETETIRVVIR